MKTYTLLDTYTLMLDMLILSLLALAINFNLTDNEITNSIASRRGTIRTMVISWQSLLVLASFCVFLRYIARNVK
jgi:hypothetical protein